MWNVKIKIKENELTYTYEDNFISFGDIECCLRYFKRKDNIEILKIEIERR